MFVQRAFLLFGLVICFALSARAAVGGVQSASAKASRPVELSGVVMDPSGALVQRAAVHITASGGSFTRDLVASRVGQFSVHLPPGLYELVVTAPGFDRFSEEIRIVAAPVSVAVQLVIAPARTALDVSDDNDQLNTSGSANRSALDLKGGALATLSDDDATFQQQLLALAGGGDQANPPQIYVDGFSGGSIPPKSAIREVRINHNPYSAEYDTMGLGRIEIFTKPGTGSLHGSLDLYGDPSALNSRNPFLHDTEPGYYRTHTIVNLSGPLGGRTSFFLSADYYDQQSNAILNAQTVNDSGAIESVSEAIPDPTTNATYTVRLDRQWTPSNISIARFSLYRAGETNDGLSLYVLPSEAYTSTARSETLQLSDTQVLGAKAEVDSRFEWIRNRTGQIPLSDAPAILVPGTVSAGGNPAQGFSDHLDHFELQENGTYARGNHFLRAGLRYRLDRDANASTAGFNGTFTFIDLAAYQAFVLGAPTASQFQITTGRSNFSVTTGDLALWAEDEWKLRSNLTADLGFRFESQSAIPDHTDPSPHIGVAWGIGQSGTKPAWVVLRVGSGIFYDRFPVADLMTAVRQSNPDIQQTYTVSNPQFVSNSIPAASQLGAATPPTIYRVAPDFRTEYEIDSGVEADFTLGRRGTFALNYLNSFGEHQTVSINANAPRADGTRPSGAAAGNIYEFSSGGESRSYWITARPQVSITPSISAWGFFVLRRANGDTSGPASFASNSYNVHQDYGRVGWDRHQTAFVGVNSNFKWGIEANLFLATLGGHPFNITTGADNNGDTIYNDRPSFATAGSNPANVVHTAYGSFDLNPQPGETIIPVDFGRSAGPLISLQMEASKTWTFGPRPGVDVASSGQPARRPDPRYALVFSVEAQNLTNTVSPATPVGVLTSPFFGQPISAANSYLITTAANRTFTLHTSLRF